MTDTESPGRHWSEAVLDDDYDTHAVEEETYARVHYHADGTVTFDEGWRGAFIESDTLVELGDWR